jgi:hypothetical protein
MANRYWVGGTGNWSDTAHWSTSNGGSGGAAVPTSSDNVWFTNLGFPTGGTCTLDQDAVCGNFQLQYGTFDANDFNVTASSVSLASYIGNPVLNMGNGTWTINGDGGFSCGDICSDPIKPTIDAEGSTILITSSCNVGLGLIDRTWNNITIQASVSLIAGSAFTTPTITINNLTINTPGITVYFDSDIASWEINNFVANGAGANLINISSEQGPSFDPQTTINATSVDFSHLIVHGIIAGGTAAPFNAGFCSVDNGRNENWTFIQNGTLPIYNPSITSSLAKIEQGMSFPTFVFGGQGTGSEYALFKKSTNYNFNAWRSPVYQIGKNFDVLEIKFAVVGGITGNKEIIPKLYFDHEATSSIGATINATNYPNSEKLIKLTAKNFSNAVHGKNNFFLELQFIGSDLAVVKLPITIDIDVLE